MRTPLGADKAARVRGTRSVDGRLNSAIIRMLEEDGRMPYSEIAQRLQVSRSATV